MTKRPDVKTFLDVAEDAGRSEAEIKEKYGESTVYINNKETDTQGFMALKAIDSESKGALIIAFKGSKEFQDWVNDFDAWHRVIPYGNYDSDIRVHKGFLSCYKSVRGEILQFVQKNKSRIERVYVTGHSLGGALSLLCAVDIQYNTDLAITVYTSGAPAVGNKAFARSYNTRVPDTTRTYMKTDIVPKLPPKWFGFSKYSGYKHVERSNGIGPNNIWVGLKFFFHMGRKDLIKNVTNHSIDLYRKWC